MNRFVLKNTFMKIYIYRFLINIFREIKSQSCVLKTVSLSWTSIILSMEGVFFSFAVEWRQQWLLFVSVDITIRVLVVQPAFCSDTDGYGVLSRSARDKDGSSQFWRHQWWCWKRFPRWCQIVMAVLMVWESHISKGGCGLQTAGDIKQVQWLGW